MTFSTSRRATKLGTVAELAGAIPPLILEKGVLHVSRTTNRRRISRHLLVSPWGVWQCRALRGFPHGGDWAPGRLISFWLDCPDHGVCHRPYLWVSSEPGGVHRVMGWWTISCGRRGP